MGRTQLSDTVVVITGASSGIGRATALRCAELGATLAVVARRDDALAELADECRRRSAARGHRGDVLHRAIDVTDAAAVQQVADDVVGVHGRIDAWVNNAAVHLFAPVETAPVEDWHRVIEINLFGTYHGVRAVVPYLREQASGTIVNVASVLSRISAPQQSAYVASKYAIRGLSDAVRQELAELPEVHVCTVLPGPIDTPLFQHAGNYTGKRVKPLSPVIDAWRVAEAIVGCILRPRREAVVGATPRGGMLAATLAPGLAEREARRQIESGHFADAPATADSGNLDRPTGPASVSGGWNRRGDYVGPDHGVSASEPSAARRSVVAAGAAGVVGLASAATAVALRRRQS